MSTMASNMSRCSPASRAGQHRSCGRFDQRDRRSWCGRRLCGALQLHGARRQLTVFAATPAAIKRVANRQALCEAPNCMCFAVSSGRRDMPLPRRLPARLISCFCGRRERSNRPTLHGDNINIVDIAHDVLLSPSAGHDLFSPPARFCLPPTTIPKYSW